MVVLAHVARQVGSGFPFVLKGAKCAFPRHANLRWFLRLRLRLPFPLFSSSATSAATFVATSFTATSFASTLFSTALLCFTLTAVPILLRPRHGSERWGQASVVEAPIAATALTIPAQQHGLFSIAASTHLALRIV
jgi:hypothetical protein